MGPSTEEVSAKGAMGVIITLTFKYKTSHSPLTSVSPGFFIYSKDLLPAPYRVARPTRGNGHGCSS